MPFNDRNQYGYLTHNEKMFGYFYILYRGNARKAYKKVFDCKDSTAAVEGPKLLKNNRVRNFVQNIMQPIFDKYQISVNRIMEELASIGFSNITDVARIEGGTLRIKDTAEVELEDPRALSGISEISVIGGHTNIKMHQKVDALKALGKYHGLEADFNTAVMVLSNYGYKMVQNAETGELELRNMRNSNQIADYGPHVKQVQAADAQENYIEVNSLDEATCLELPNTITKLEDDDKHNTNQIDLFEAFNVQFETTEAQLKIEEDTKKQVDEFLNEPIKYAEQQPKRTTKKNIEATKKITKDNDTTDNNDGFLRSNPYKNK